MEICITHVSGGYAGRRETFSKDRLTVGRAADNDVRLSPEDLRVSAHHAVLLVSEGGVVIEDVGSTNGTYVNGLRVVRARLHSGDVVQLGRRGPRLQIEILAPGDDASSRQTAPTLLVPSEPIGRTTVRVMIDRALRHSSRAWRRWTIGMVVGLMAALGAVIAILLRADREPASSESASAFAQIAARNQAAVVLIRHHFRLLDARGREISSAVSEGSGFAIDPRGVIATNYHLLHPWEFDPHLLEGKARPVSDAIDVIFADRTLKDALRARPLRESREMDVALVKVETSRPLPVVEGFEPDLTRVRQGDEVVIIGFPLGSALLEATGQERATTTLTRSTISKVSATLIQLDAPVLQGYSGSPIFTRDGRVIGLLTARLGERGEPIDPNARAIGLGTPVRFLLHLLKEGL